MGTEIAIRSATLPEKIAYADNLACSGMLPKQFQGKPANILWATEYGETLGITTMAAINGIHVIENKPSASAALIGGLVRRAGHKLRVTGNSLRATAQIVRSDDPDFVFEVTWELRRNPNGNPNAEEAGLLNKSTWKNYPAAMLKSRAITQVARDACEEVLFGLHYTPEELGAEVDAEGEPIEPRAQRVTARPAEPDPWETPVQDGPVAFEPEYAEVVEERGPAQATKQQYDDIVEGLRVVRGVESPEGRRNALSQLLGREFTEGTALTRPDAERVLSALRTEDEANQKQRQQDEREAARAAEVAAVPAVADRQQVDWILSGLTNVRGITDPQSKRVAIEYMVGVEMPDPYRMTAEQAASVRAVLESEYVAAQQDDPAPATKATQKRKNAMHAAFNGMGITDHTERIAYAGLVIGHAVASTNDLTAAEVEQVIEALGAGRTIDSFPISERAAQLKSMVWSAVSSDNLAEVSERFWQAHEGGEISDVERDVLISASGRREQQLAQQQKAPVAA